MHYYYYYIYFFGSSPILIYTVELWLMDAWRLVMGADDPTGLPGEYLAKKIVFVQ